MLILVGAGHETSMKYAGPGFGRLVQPRDYGRIDETAAAGIPWAADNDCFQGLNAGAYSQMLAGILGLDGCKFVTAPDVVGDSEQTWRLFLEWRDRLHACGQPIGFVLQDGATRSLVPWDDIQAVFVGGTTAWKLGHEAEFLVRHAKWSGLWVHMGRVNSRKRFEYARQIGCDSVDGTMFSKWRDRWLPDALGWHRDHLQERMSI